jgi:3-oxoacyl-[acyl-carrier protein] reductase
MTLLSGKVALVTGASRGIGKVVAQRLAAEGAALIVHYAKSRAGAEEVVQVLRQKGCPAIAVQADLSQRREVRRMFQEIDLVHGSIDILVNGAGVSGATPLEALEDDKVDELLGINFLAPLYVASEACQRMGEGGRIVNFSSSIAQFPFPGSSVYAGAKAAVKTFTEVWAKELGPKGITVNTVIPGATSPGMAQRAAQVHRDYFAKASPFARIGRAEEVAEVVAFLCSPGASWVSGTHILVNGAASA